VIVSIISAINDNKYRNLTNQLNNLREFLPRQHVRPWLPWMMSSYLNPKSVYSNILSTFTPFELLNKDSKISANSLQSMSDGWIMDESLNLQVSCGNDNQLHLLFTSYLNQCSEALSKSKKLSPLTLNLSGSFCNSNLSVPSISAFTSLLVFRESLIDLTLSHCNLIVVPEVVLMLARLKRLDLSKNLLKNLPAGISKCLLHLEILSIAWNLFEEFPSEVKLVASLKELYIKG
jgi:Leucine-rich repeat (LRR) protein